jgi:hypothetical protein
MPSKVEVNVLLCASSATHSALASAAPAALLMSEMFGPATQYAVLLLIQKTSRQQADIPRFGGRFENEVLVGSVGIGLPGPGEDGVGCD